MNVAKDQEVSAHNTGSGIAQSFNFGDMAAKYLLMIAALFSALAVMCSVVLFIVVIWISHSAAKAEASAEAANKIANAASGEAEVATYNFTLLQGCMESTKCDARKLEFRKGSVR